MMLRVPRVPIKMNNKHDDSVILPGTALVRCLAEEAVRSRARKGCER